MFFLGPDFSAGLRQALYRPFNPAGLRQAICIFLGLVIGNQLLQGLFGYGFAVTSGQFTHETEVMRALLLSVLPAGLLTAYVAWILARRRGADPLAVLALRAPALGVFGWITIIGGFLFSIFAFFHVLSWLFDVDLTESGMVEKAVTQLSHDPLYFLIAAGLVVGAPFAEEFTFRGQIFAALSQTRAGLIGASIITSALWAVMHITQPHHVIALLFLMGLALCWLLVRFGSLWVTILCHAVWNGISAVVLYAMSLQ